MNTRSLVYILICFLSSQLNSCIQVDPLPGGSIFCVTNASNEEIYCEYSYKSLDSIINNTAFININDSVVLTQSRGDSIYRERFDASAFNTILISNEKGDTLLFSDSPKDMDWRCVDKYSYFGGAILTWKYVYTNSTLITGLKRSFD